MEPETDDNIIWENSEGAIPMKKFLFKKKKVHLKKSNSYNIAETSPVV